MKRMLVVAALLLWASVALANEEITVDLSGEAQMEFVWIEPGTFVMGDSTAHTMKIGPDPLPYPLFMHDSYSVPAHTVTITKGFYLGKYELTQGQWKAVMGTTPWLGRSYVQDNPLHPAVWISWNDMQVLLQKLNNAAGEAIYRLPTEAEWEYACRAGTTTRWPFGDNESQLNRYEWYEANAYFTGEQYAHAVGTKLPNPWKLHDMLGNVSEWCQDWYGVYPSSNQTYPTGPAAARSRIYRGGAFCGSARNIRPTQRYSDLPDTRLLFIGARLVRIR